jgi:hypothetical protein
VTTSPSPESGSPAEARLLSWQSALTAEQQAVFGYQVVAARLRAEDDPSAVAAAADLTQHRRRGDRAAAEIALLGVTPAPAEPAYVLPTPVTDASAAVELASRLEKACAQAYADLVAAAAPTDRQVPAEWLVSAAVAQTRWSGTVPSLPGLDDRSPPAR